MSKVNTFVSRKSFFVASLSVFLMAIAIGSVNTRTTSAQSGGGFNRTAIFKVTLTTPAPAAGAAVGSGFVIAGDITFVNKRGQQLNDGTGKFYRAGVINSDGTSLVNDVYVLDSFGGTITANGILKGAVVGSIEQADIIAATGGTGTFRGLSGEAQITTAADGTFTVVIEEGPRRGNNNQAE